MAHPILPVAPGRPPPPAGVPVPVAPVAPPKTYRELYADAANNPRLDRTAGYLGGYRFADAAGGAVPTPITLRDQTIALSDRQPMAFLCLVNGLEGPEVSVVHRVLRYMDSPGDDPSGYHDRVLGLLGDILPHQYPTVEVPNTTFHLVGTPVRVPTVAAMEAHVPTWEDPRVALGPFTEEDPETEVVRPRNTQLIPGRYASIIIHRRRVNAKQAYQEIVGAIRADEALESCQDVVTWLRAACTARGGGGAQNALPGVLHPLPALHLPPEVYRYVTSKVQNDLPATTPDMGGTGETAATLVGALRALAQRPNEDEGGEGGRGSTKAPKTVAEAFKETHRTLLRFCNVATVDEVAPVWVRLANCHKSEQYTLLSQEMQKVCMARGLSTEVYLPVVTTALKQMIVGFRFEGHGADDLETGCQPFLVAYAGRDHHIQQVTTASVADQLAQGEQQASLADYRTLRESERLKFPRDVTDVCITLFRYSVLCQCLFQGVGAPHPYVEALWSTAVTLQNIAPFVTERYNDLARNQIVNVTYFARILRAVQMSAHEYLHGVSTNVAETAAGVDVPSFATMMQDLKRGTFQNSTNWLPIPPTYMDPGPAPSAHRAASTTAGVPTTAGSTASVTNTTVSTLTGETPRTVVARITNPQTDAEFNEMTLRPGGTRNILREHRPPTNDAGHEFCVAWWTRGGCFPNCRRRAAHAPFASPSERTRLLTFVRAHLVASPAGGATSA